MTTRTLIRMGNPILRRRAKEIEDPTAPAIAALVEDMKETMEAEGGVGLAAPQIGVDLRLVIFMVPAGRTEDGEGLPLTVLINPVIEPLDEEIDEGFEGCLSVPGLTGLVPRFRNIRYSGLAPDGSVIEREAHGFHARVVQHECDHLDGVLYPQRMTDMASLAFVAELRRVAEAEVME